MTTIGPFVGHYHDDRVHCGVCSHCLGEMNLFASHHDDECFMLALCESCDAPVVARMWDES